MRPEAMSLGALTWEWYILVRQVVSSLPGVWEAGRVQTYVNDFPGATESSFFSSFSDESGYSAPGEKFMNKMNSGTRVKLIK